MESILEIGEHCADCAAGLGAAAEILRHEDAGHRLSARAQFWEEAAHKIAEHVAAVNATPLRCAESVRASLYRARIKILAAIYDVQAIVDDCLWWDSLTRTQCTQAARAVQSPALAALLGELSRAGPAMAAFDSARLKASRNHLATPGSSGSAECSSRISSTREPLFRN